MCFIIQIHLECPTTAGTTTSARIGFDRSRMEGLVTGREHEVFLVTDGKTHSLTVVFPPLVPLSYFVAKVSSAKAANITNINPKARIPTTTE